MADEESSSDDETNKESSSSTDDEESDTEDEDEPPKPPKLPLRANNYFIRLNYMRMAVRLGPGAKSSEIFRRLNEEWNGLSRAQKAPYVQQATADLARYQKQLWMYRLKYARMKKNPAARPPKRKLKRRNAPRPPPSAMQIYILEQLPLHQRMRQFQNWSRRQLVNGLKDAWARRNEQQKKPYKERHEAALKEFHVQRREYQQKRVQGLVTKKVKRKWPLSCRQQ